MKRQVKRRQSSKRRKKPKQKPRPKPAPQAEASDDEKEDSSEEEEESTPSSATGKQPQPTVPDAAQATRWVERALEHLNEMFNAAGFHEVSEMFMFHVLDCPVVPFVFSTTPDSRICRNRGPRLPSALAKLTSVTAGTRRMLRWK